MVICSHEVTMNTGRSCNSVLAVACTFRGRNLKMLCAHQRKTMCNQTEKMQLDFVQRSSARRSTRNARIPRKTAIRTLMHSFCKRCNKRDQSNKHSRCVHATATSKSHTNKHFDHASSPAPSSNRHQRERCKLHPYRHLSANFEIFWRASRTMLREADSQEAPTMVKQNPIIEHGSLQGP